MSAVLRELFQEDDTAIDLSACALNLIRRAPGTLFCAQAALSVARRQ
jgi:hypothetical protein